MIRKVSMRSGLRSHTAASCRYGCLLIASTWWPATLPQPTIATLSVRSTSRTFAHRMVCDNVGAIGPELLHQLEWPDANTHAVLEWSRYPWALEQIASAPRLGNQPAPAFGRRAAYQQEIRMRWEGADPSIDQSLVEKLPARDEILDAVHNPPDVIECIFAALERQTVRIGDGAQQRKLPDALRLRDAVSEAQTREAERLRKRSGDDEIRIACHQTDCGPGREQIIGLIHHDHGSALVRFCDDLFNLGIVHHRPGRLVRIGEHDQPDGLLPQRADDRSRIESQVPIIANE